MSTIPKCDSSEEKRLAHNKGIFHLGQCPVCYSGKIIEEQLATDGRELPKEIENHIADSKADSQAFPFKIFEEWLKENCRENGGYWYFKKDGKMSVDKCPHYQLEDLRKIFEKTK